MSSSDGESRRGRRSRRVAAQQNASGKDDYKAKSCCSTGSEPDGDDTFSLCDTTAAFLDQFRGQVGLFIYLLCVVRLFAKPYTCTCDSVTPLSLQQARATLLQTPPKRGADDSTDDLSGADMSDD